MTRVLLTFLTLLPVTLFGGAQNPTTAPAKPTEHLLGTITAIDPSAQTITVKEDKTGIVQTVLLADTKTLLKVLPGAKDLKNATRITSDQLVIGDRVDVRGFKSPDDPGKTAGRSVVLMSARDLQQVHQSQAAEWRQSTAAVVTSVDAASGRILANERTAVGPKPVVIESSPQTEFTRYSPDTPNSPIASQLSQVQPGDQIRIVGEKNSDGAAIVAKRIYSGSFKTLNGTVLTIAAGGKQLTIRDLVSKKPVTIQLNRDSTVRKIPPEMAMNLARRLNPAARQDAGSSSNGTDTPPSPPANQFHGAAPGGPGMHGPRNGDISQMIERLPQISLSDLKPGDAVVVSGAASGAGGTELTATNIIAGVEPILQSAPARQRGQALGGDWGLSEIAPPQ
ncbi:MAG: DUF5666 domain-containing protein [Acidobacteriota bacterium]|nr:DUF5666 domain-containing protein [Acidobacteriota bacterium]